MVQALTFRADDGIVLHTEVWPSDSPRRVVAIVQGGADHIGRYDRLAQALVADGAYVFGADHRGQGLSGGPRGHVDRFEDYSVDLALVIHKALAAAPESVRSLPLFIFGHSTGALITLIHLLDHSATRPIRGAIISAPLLGLTMPVPAIKRLAGKLVGRFAPRLGFPSGIPPESICRDPEVVAKYRADLRRVTVVTPGWADAMEAAIGRVDREVSRIRTPLRWIHGTEDGICDFQASQRAFAKLSEASARDQTFHAYEGYFHELHNEPEALRAPVFADVLGWIRARSE